MGKKKEILAALYKRYKSGKLGETFTNEDVKNMSRGIGFSNQFDVTKIDYSDLLPSVMRNDDRFVAHLGEGKHAFLKGISLAYRRLENLQPQEFKYERSLLNETDTSESSLLFAAYNARLLHDFLYDEKNSSPKVYGRRRTKIRASYLAGEQRVEVKKLQMEIDMTLENKGAITVLEAKNGKPEDFAVYQLFMPFLYYSSIPTSPPVKSVNCCYLARAKKERSLVFAYLYDFADKKNIASIRLRKHKGYKLIPG